ncbi:MAG: trigger factor, partial [Gemmatimonadales bacterium]
MTGITFETTAEDAASKSLHVTVATDRLAESEQRAVREYAKRARLPGFRKGHAPEPVVRRRFESEIRRWVLEDALRESWDAIRKEKDLKPTGDPQVRNVSFEAGKPLTFELLVEVRPEITLTTMGGFQLKRTVPPVTDEMVNEQLQRLREQRGTWNPVAGGHAKPGNRVTVTVTPVEAEGEAGTAPSPEPHDIV